LPFIVMFYLTLEDVNRVGEVLRHHVHWVRKTGYLLERSTATS
jgi:hypothetical protein